MWLEQLQKNLGSRTLDLLRELLTTREDGRVKQFLIARALGARRSNPPLFREGKYSGMETTGRFRRHVVAFAREHAGSWSITIAPRFLTALIVDNKFPMGPEIWEDTRVILPNSAPWDWRNVLTDQPLCADGSLQVGDALGHFPVALVMH